MAGMSMLVRQMLVLEPSGTSDTDEKLDRVRLEMGEDFEKNVRGGGLRIGCVGRCGKV